MRVVGRHSLENVLISRPVGDPHYCNGMVSYSKLFKYQSISSAKYNKMTQSSRDDFWLSEAIRYSYRLCHVNKKCFKQIIHVI